MAVLALNKANFKKTIERNAFVIIDFWADWCEPCIAFTEIFEQLAANRSDIVFGRLDIDQDPDIASYFHIKQIPCVLAIRDQVVIDGQVGAMTAVEFERLIKQWHAFDTSEINRHFSAKEKPHS